MKAFSPNRTRLSGCLDVKELKTSIFNTLHKSQVPVDQRPQSKATYTKSNRTQSGNSLKVLGIGDNFLKRTPMAQALRSTTDKWNLIKLQRFCKAKDPISRAEWQSSDWERILTNPTSDKGLISKIYKELKKLDINPIIHFKK